MDLNTFTRFETWDAVVSHVAAGLPIYYHAPMDVRPVWVRCEVRARQRIRVFPPSPDADPFTADASHLDRFRVRVAHTKGSSR